MNALKSLFSLRAFKKAWFLLAAVTLAYLLAIALDVTPYLRGPAAMDVEWRWPRYAEPPYGRLWLLLLALLLYLGLCLWMERLAAGRLSTRGRVALLAALVVAALAVQGGVLYLARPDVVPLLFERNASPLADGYYTAALAIDETGRVADFFGDYSSRMPAFLSDHPRTHPPGFPLLHWTVGHTLGRLPALQTWVRWQACPTLRVNGLAAAQMTSVLIVGVATPLLSALALLPIYALARQRGGVRTGLRAAALFPLLPAFTLFAPQMDQLFPLLAASILWTFTAGWKRQRPGWLLASGLLFSLATFLSLGLVALALWLALYVAYGWLAGNREWTGRQLAAAGLAFGLGAASLWLICWVAFGLDPLAVARTGMAQHFEIVTGRRDYRLWIAYNLYDLAAFLGLPLAFLFLSRLRHAVGRRWRQGDAVAVATALAILILDVSGASRGEVARLWLFLAPPVVLVVASVVAQRRSFLTLAVLQASSLLVLSLFLDVVPIVPLPTLERARPATAPFVQHKAAATFGDQIALVGYDLSPSLIRPGETLDLTLHWRALAEPQESYKVFIHLLDPGGALSDQADAVPLDWSLPTTCWVCGEAIADPYTLTLPPDAPPGDYTLAVGFYCPDTGKRLPVDGQDHVLLGPVTVSPPP